MARVLIFANDNSTIYNFRRELLRRLVGEDFEVTVALPAHERNEAFRQMGCEVVELPLSRFGMNPVAELFTWLSFVRIIRTVAPDVVLAFTMKPNIYGGIAAQVCRVPYITAVTGLGAVFQTPSVVLRLTTLLLRLALRKASVVFSENSENLARLEQLGVVRGNGEVVSGAGVNLDLHRLEPYAEDIGRVRFITVSRIRSDKGYDELFAAIRLVCAARDDVEFHVVGWYEDDSYRDTVANMQSHFPVVVHGEVSQAQLHELLAESHALIHPSHHEGMANVILEASATGVPPLASDIAGCRESIEDGITGLLFRVKDEHALAAVIDRFMALSWQEHRLMGLAARKKMEAEFDREHVVDRYVGALRSAALGHLVNR